MDGSSNNIVALVQARMTSTRLPGKVFKEIHNEPILIHLIRRIQQSQLINQIVVITSTDKSDDILASFCKANGIDVYRGSMTDLLDRHLKAAKHFKATVCLKIPSDCPLIDAQIIDTVLRNFLTNNVEYCSNLHPMTLPDGMDVEVFTIEALAKANSLATTQEEFEHTTTLMWKSREFTKYNIAFTGYEEAKLRYRFTVDYEEDFTLVKKIFEHFLPTKPYFSIDEIIQLVDSDQKYQNINANRLGDIWYMR